MTLKEIGFLDKNYYQRNYVEVVKSITPQLYIDEDQSLSGTYTDPLTQLLNSHLDVANNIARVINPSATSNYSSINTLQGISPFFIRQNGFTYITPFTFERDILSPLGTSFNAFTTSSDFKAYIDSTLIPRIKLNNPSTSFGSTASAAHEYLIDSLGWFYLLNTSALGNLNVAPSSYISNAIVQNLYYGQPLKIADGLKGLNYLLWQNQGVSSLYSSLIPHNYGSSVNSSGYQQLNTLIDILYNAYDSDRSDTYVRDAFQNFIDASVYVERTESAGPFERLLKAFSMLIYDVNAQVEVINTLVDIENCPDQYLPFLANLIGWKLITEDPNKWRHQLRLAISIYKSKGTKKALQVAINTVAPSGVFNPTSGILELYESYVPYLIYYALLTESTLFANGYDSWTPSIANSLGVSDYTNSSFDQNIRFAVDTIIYKLVQEFPDHFILGNKFWDLSDPDWIFNYRGRNFKVPPFEEFRYYEEQFLSRKLISELERILVCFGVRQDFAAQLSQYIRNYSLDSQSDEITFGNSWLFFTPSSISAPNFNLIISDTTRNRSEYLTLWNGKSSHFRLVFNVSAVNFSTATYDASSYLSIVTTSRFINEFAPFHAIPDILLFLNVSSDLEQYADAKCFQIEVKKEHEVAYASGMAFAGSEISGVSMSTANHAFSRYDVDNIRDTLISSVTAIIAPRNSIRRRNYYNLLPRAGLYSRTGWNMPSQDTAMWSGGNYTSYLSSYIPLGFVPSTLDFYPAYVSGLTSSVWSKCENYNSTSIWFGVPTSSTFPFKGLESTISALYCDKYKTRGVTFNDIIGTMAMTLIKRELNYWKNNIPTYDSNGLPLALSSGWMNLSATYQALSGTTPSSINEFYGFRFGLDVHKFYKDYTNIFLKGGARIDLVDSNGGFDIFSHTYGPLIYNGKFKIDGSSVAVNPQFIASSLNGASSISVGFGSGILSEQGLTSGTYIVSTLTGTDFYVGNYEFRNPSFISGVELLAVSGSSNRNKFEIFNVAQSNAVFNDENFAVRNPLVRLVNVGNLNRLRFDLNRYGPSANTFIPEHEFELNISTLPGTITGRKLGGSILGVWIHTRPENGTVWSFVPGPNIDKGNYCPIGDRWIETNISDASSMNNLLNIYSFLIPFPISSLDDQGACYEPSGADKFGNIPIESNNFVTSKIKFNTFNNRILVSNTYYKAFQQVHRLNQKYVVEIFMIPDKSGNTYQLYNGVSIIDKTENNRVAEYSTTDVVNILKFFNYCSEGNGSRVASTTSAVYGVSGGSRANLRVHPEWYNFAKSSANSLHYSSIDLSQ